MFSYLKSQKLGPLLTGSFVTIIGLVIVSAFATYRSRNDLLDAADFVEHTYQVKLALEEIEANAMTVSAAQRGYLFTDDERYLAHYDAAKGMIKERIADLRRLVSDNPAEERNLDIAERLATQRIALTDRLIAMKRAGNGDIEITRIMRIGTGRVLADQLKASLDKMQTVEQRFLVQRQKRVLRFEQIEAFVLVSATLIIIFLLMALMLYISRKALKPVREITAGLATSAMEMSATVQQHERIATQQAASVSETTTTMDELGASFSATAGQAETAASEARQSLALTDEGAVAVERAYAGMLSLKEKVSDISEQILRLSERTGQIGVVTNLVSDLASQTNMLALNAAVEAARAGDQGKGFNVVATEIRKLADESKRSAERINLMVSEIQKATNLTVMAAEEGAKTVEEGLKLAQSSGETFNRLASSSRNAFQNIQQIMLNVKQQSSAIQQVVDAMTSLNAGARETAAGTAQTKSAAGHLNQSAQKLKSII
jgi:methyl-accepting chemotaxis protein